MNNVSIIHVPAADPLCTELQGGHDHYSEGLVLSVCRHYVGPFGDWLVSAGEVAPERERQAGRTVANVHPVLSNWDETKRHEGRWVYAVRYWEAK